MAFREKIQYILPFEADIIIVPECEAPDKWNKSTYKDRIQQFLWFGTNQNKGLGIFTLNNKYSVEVHPMYSTEFRYIVPLIVRGEEDFILLAVWTQNNKAGYLSYIGQLFMALQYYSPLLINQPCMIAGDWNSSKNFDSKKRVGNHTETVNMLEQLHIHSMYHQHYAENQGLESTPTHYFRKKKESPFHIDYIFASEYFSKRNIHMHVGEYEQWIKQSDHMPMITEFKDKPS